MLYPQTIKIITSRWVVIIYLFIFAFNFVILLCKFVNFTDGTLATLETCHLPAAFQKASLRCMQDTRHMHEAPLHEAHVPVIHEPSAKYGWLLKGDAPLMLARQYLIFSIVSRWRSSAFPSSYLQT